MDKPSKIAVCIGLSSILAGCNSHSYYDEAQKYLGVTYQVLIQNGVCRIESDCSQMQVALFSSGGWNIGPLKGGGVGIEVYRVSDLVLARKIVEGCRKLHSQIPEVPVSITIYSNPHIDNLHPGTPQIVLREKIS